MRQNLRYFLCLVIGIGFLLPTADAQTFVNYEETWQEFLRNPLTSSVSKLAKPEKTQVSNYLKWCLMNGNSFYCSDDLTNAEDMIREISAISGDAQAKIPNFIARFGKMKADVAAYKACGKVWHRFVGGESIDLKELESAEVAGAKKVCEKGTLCKYFYMTSKYYYCKGDLSKSRGAFENRVQKLVDKTSFEPSQVDGMAERVKIMKKLWKAIDKLDPAWETLVESGKSPGFDTEVPLFECYSIPNMKEYILRAMADVCGMGGEMLKKIKALQESNEHPIPADVREKIEWLEEQVEKNVAGLATLNKAWGKFVPDNKVPTGIDYGHEFVCDRAAEVKAYIMDGFKDPCGGGKAALDKIKEIREEHKPALDKETMKKLEALKARVNKEEENIAKLNEAWEDFVPDDKVSGKLDFPYEYCDKEAQIKAYTMDGTINFCAKGKQRLEDIQKLRDSDDPELADIVIKKVENLQAKQDESDLDLANLNESWALYVSTDKVMKWEEGYPQKDTLVRDSMKLVKFYCDKIAQTKSWVIKGQLDPCQKGEPYLKKIDALKAKESLSYDKELTCQVGRLREKVYQCKYWTLVLKAWKITYDECERFGPSSSEIMKAKLNEGEMPCETRVAFEQLGKIGIKYTITTVLCQKINLASMGDPLYYKKIADWVDAEVLQKYCNTTNWRCKKDFFIYLEGHTDGHRFSGATYDKSLDIPEGTPYTHFVGKSRGAGADTLQKETRNITSKLESNMELGIARAWTVKQQLDFMKVPITIGAYEHPSDEKDKDYRRIEIELNITNLFLDFYEKTLKQLVDESGIGSRPGSKC